MGPEAQWEEKLTAALSLCSEAWLLFAWMWNFRPHPHLAFLVFQLLTLWLLSLRQDRVGLGGLKHTGLPLISKLASKEKFQ